MAIQAARRVPVHRARIAVEVCAACIMLAGLPSLPARAAITANQVLVVYNSKSIDAQLVLDAYLAAHPDIPATNVVDLDAAAIANVADVTYAEFVTNIRNPIRAWLDVSGHPQSSDIICLCLIRGIPHRIKDFDSPSIGDDPYGQVSEFSNGDATAASVDSELVLLWQDLDAGEAGGMMDSHSDNCIVNPYRASTARIDSFSRLKIKTPKTFSAVNGVWRSTGTGSAALTPGDMYLVCRIDGTTVADAVSAITRAGNLYVNRLYAWIVLDKDAIGSDLDNQDACSCQPPLLNSGPDYLDASKHLSGAGWNVLYDDTSQFIQPAVLTRPIIAYAGYGANHKPSPPSPRTYLDGFLFAPGAMFATMESYNGRAFNGLGTLCNQEQIASFIHAGGTFGVGSVWEPFAFSVPDIDALTSGMLLQGMTFAEAAWTSIPALGWQQIAVGDPLGRVISVVLQPGDFNADAVVDDADFNYLGNCMAPPATTPPANGCADADLNGDDHVDMLDFAAFQRCICADPALLNPGCAD